MIHDIESRPKEQQEKFEAFKELNESRILQWKATHHNPPPIFWDEIKKTFYWANRDQRRAAKQDRQKEMTSGS